MDDNRDRGTQHAWRGLPHPPRRLVMQSPHHHLTATSSTPAAQAVGFDLRRRIPDASPASRQETVGLPPNIIDPCADRRRYRQYRFHPALIDGAFQTLIGTTLLGREADEDAYLPTRIRHSAIYRAPEQHMTAQSRWCRPPRTRSKAT